MITWNSIKFNLKQIFAIAEKNTKMTLRYKFVLIIGLFNPLIQLIFPFILMGQFFSYQDSFGPWNAENYIVYILIGYNVLLFQRVINIYGGQFLMEKFFGTLQALIVAPFNRYNLLLGYIVTHLIEVFIPFTIFLIIVYIFFPISPLTIIFTILLFLCLLLIFAGIGLFVGVFSIAKEGVATWLKTILRFVFLFSCISYPYQIFPLQIQIIVNCNPIYYIIDIIRLTWIENSVFYTILNHPIHFLMMALMLISFPLLGIFMFNYIFKKYGIEGY